VERLYRVVLFGLFILGFLGAAASADLVTNTGTESSSKTLVSMIKDIRLVQEVNDINSNKWDQDVSNINEDGLSKVEALLTSDETQFENHSKQ
jgi:hypothetical protein